MYVGVRAGGGIGDEIEDPAGDPYEMYRIVFDITFFFFVIVILLAIIQGTVTYHSRDCQNLVYLSSAMYLNHIGAWGKFSSIAIKTYFWADKIVNSESNNLIFNSQIMHCPKDYTKHRNITYQGYGVYEHIDNYPAMRQLVQDHCSSYSNHLNLESLAVDTLHTFSLELPELAGEWRLYPWKGEMAWGKSPWPQTHFPLSLEDCLQF